MTEPPVTSKLSPDGTCMNTLNNGMETAGKRLYTMYTVSIIYACSNLQRSTTQRFLPQICIELEAVLLKLHVIFAHSSKF